MRSTLAQTLEVAIDGPTDEPRSRLAPIPGHDEVVEPQAQLGQRLILGRYGRHLLEASPEIVGEVAGQSARPVRGAGRQTPAHHAMELSPRGRERVAAPVAALEGDQGIRGQVAPIRASAGSGALQQDEARPAPQALGRVEWRDRI